MSGAGRGGGQEAVEAREGDGVPSAEGAREAVGARTDSDPRRADPAGQDRRTFLKTTGAALSAVAVGGCAPATAGGSASAGPDAGASRNSAEQASREGAGGDAAPGGVESRTDASRADAMDPALLAAVGHAVLPGELGAAGRASAVEDFRAWALAYRPVPELNHGYGTSQIRYGPADPVPGWGAQLSALDLEARQRHATAFTELDPDRRDALVRGALDDAGPGVPSPLQAGHVALAVLAHWLDTPRATDLCYEVRIAPRTCRSIDSAPAAPGAAR